MIELAGNFVIFLFRICVIQNLTLISYNMTTNFNFTGFTFYFIEHRNQQVILCQFVYAPALIRQFKQEFPSAKWSRTHKGWYLPNNTLYRNRLGIPGPEVGDQYLDNMYSVNREEFIKFRNALTQRIFSQNTLKTYLYEFAQLLILLKKHPVYELDGQRLNAYFLYCIKKLNHSENHIYSRMNAIKTYFKLVRNDVMIFEHVIKPKPRKSLPSVLSKDEVKRLFLTTSNSKHLLILKMAYGMGLRVSELIGLKIENIDLDRKLVHVVAGKGKKDRYVNFPVSLINLYEDYLKAYQPVKFLFEGQFSEQYTTRSAQAVFKTAMKKAKIVKSIGIHGLRHSYATHLLEAGTDMVFIQKLLGHSNVKTTEIYAKVSTNLLSNVKSPLDGL